MSTKLLGVMADLVQLENRLFFIFVVRVKFPIAMTLLLIVKYSIAQWSYTGARVERYGAWSNQ